MFKDIHLWIGSYLQQEFKRLVAPQPFMKPTHIMFCVVDHFEPDWNGADAQTQMNRVMRWAIDYPTLAKRHQDANGCPARHTFFYPAEVYNKEHLDLLVKVCQEGYGEVEIHLHHDNDTEETLREKLEKAKKDFSRHGLLSQRTLSGQIRFAFVHGNWALNNSRPDGRWCGVNHESHVLSEAGCYADFTFPSAPSDTQPKKINSIYYTSSHPTQSKTHNRGIDAKVGQFTDADLMVIEGPLTLNWRNRKNGVWPRIENADISSGCWPTPERVDLWIDQKIGVKNKPDWIFVKVHTHGAPEANAKVLLGEPMDQMYSYLEKKYNDGQQFILHYTSAREMYNIIKAAEAGETGHPHQYRNYIISLNQSLG